MTLETIWTHTPRPLKMIVVLLYGTVVLPLYGVFMFFYLMVASWTFTPDRYHKYKPARDIRADGFAYVARGYSVLFILRNIKFLIRP